MTSRITQTLVMLTIGACGGGGKTSDSAGESTTAPQTTSESSGGPGGTTMATGSATTTAGSVSDSDSQATTGAPTTGSPGTSTSTGPEPGTSTGGTSTSGTTTGTTSGTTTDGTTTKGESTTGDVCVGMQGSCAMGELCCDGLECCAGIPVPPGKEFCGEICPISDRNAKTDIRPVDASDILRRVVSLEVSTWRYKKDAPEVRHLGPMAQDFKGAFGLWDTDRMIFPLDGVGVSMVAIQALHRRVVDAEAENEALRERMARIEAQLAELQRAR